MPVAGVEPAIGAGSGDAVGLDVGNAGGVRGVEIAFELFEDVDSKKRIISIIFLIFSKSLKMNLFNNIISNSEFFIIIIIFFNNLSNFFKLKKISLLNIIFFFSYIFLYYKN